MKLSRYLNHPAVQRLTKTYREGENLFKQGQPANSMFFIISGSVELVAEKDGDAHVEEILLPGHFFGEKALISDTNHQRLFGARAGEPVKVFEMTNQDLEYIQAAVPGMLAEILRGIFEITAARLDRTNYMVRALRSNSPEERLLSIIEYFCHSASRQAGRAIEVVLSVDSIHYYLDVKKEQIAAYLESLVAVGLLVPKKKNVYLVPNEAALMDYFRRPTEEEDTAA